MLLVQALPSTVGGPEYKLLGQHLPDKRSTVDDRLFKKIDEVAGTLFNKRSEVAGRLFQKRSGVFNKRGGVPGRLFNKRTRKYTGCLINLGLGHNCDYREAIGVAQESQHWDSVG